MSNSHVITNLVKRMNKSIYKLGSHTKIIPFTAIWFNIINLENKGKEISYIGTFEEGIKKVDIWIWKNIKVHEKK